MSYEISEFHLLCLGLSLHFHLFEGGTVKVGSFINIFSKALQ